MFRRAVPASIIHDDISPDAPILDALEDISCGIARRFHPYLGRCRPFGSYASSDLPGWEPEGLWSIRLTMIERIFIFTQSKAYCKQLRVVFWKVGKKG